MILYPVLVHMYLRLIYNGHEEKAISLLQRFSPEQEDYYQDDLKKLSMIIKKEHMESNELSQNFKYDIKNNLIIIPIILIEVCLWNTTTKIKLCSNILL